MIRLWLDDTEMLSRLVSAQLLAIYAPSEVGRYVVTVTSVTLYCVTLTIVKAQCQ